MAFESDAYNLVPVDTNSDQDIFVHDRDDGRTTRISVSSSGEQGNWDSYEPWFSADGRYVAFYSWASNLVPDDTNDFADMFIHDQQMGETTRVSVSSTGEQANGWSAWPAISGDGRYVAFT